MGLFVSLVIVIALAGIAAAESNTTLPSESSGGDPKCRVSGNATMDECLESFARRWDDIRRQKPQVDAVVFPLLAMTTEDLKPLCVRIDEARKECGGSIESCQSHEIARFVQKNFIYGCREKQQAQSLFADHAECILSTIQGQQQCLTKLKKTEEQPDACPRVEEFFNCIQGEVYKSCRAKGLAALVHAIDRFGCDIKNLDARVGNTKDAPVCPAADWNAVYACFQPLMTLWSGIRDNDTSYLDTAFPIFKFDRSELVRMCDIVRVIRDRCFVQIQRCPSHQLPEFANAILGLACGTQQSAFFLNYDCIRSTIKENEQCHPYTVGAWQPGHLKEVCGRMPQYFKCLEKPVLAKCGQDSVNVVTQAIRQYGCELNIDGEVRHPAAAQETTTTVSILAATSPLPPVEPQTEGTLDFAAGAPPSHGVLPPAPPALGLPPGNAQPFLQEPQTSFFLSQPIPPIVPGAPETFFNPNAVNEQQQQQTTHRSTVQPAPPAAVLLEPQQELAPDINLPVPDKFRMEATTAASSTSTTTTASASTTSTSSSTSSSASTSPSSTSTSSASTASSAKGTVAPIPNVPQLQQLCNLEKRNQLRECLNPLYRRWVSIHGNHGTNLTFPVYHYSKNEVVELCDQYASAFLRCPFSLFQECLTDDVVYLANAIFGNICSPRYMSEFSRYFDCISVVVRQRTQCLTGIAGPLLTVSQGANTRCQGARDFYTCNKWSIDQSCTSGAEKVFADTVRQFGCDLSA